MARKSNNAVKQVEISVEEIDEVRMNDGLQKMFDGSELFSDEDAIGNESQVALVDGHIEEMEFKKDDKGRFSEVRMSMEELERAGAKNKSQAIRLLASENYSPSAIAKFLNIRYQHVRNVMMQPLKRVSAVIAVVEVEEAPTED